MIALPEIDPVAFEIGPLAVRWYGLMYVIGFAAALVLGIARQAQRCVDYSRAVSGPGLLCHSRPSHRRQTDLHADLHLVFVALDFLTMGQVLSLPMIAAGGFLMFYSRVNPLNEGTGFGGKQ
ncbi:MAG: prolipoprotein diacylglyceryl transferase family protein [Desulfovermiculus sp.]|nr:prolipoprotein diacylglyceryl transferase family protein [Desulfovermiculus sp.]